MKIYTKPELIAALRAIHERGWIENTTRSSNHGAIGNLLEDLLEITENNLPLPNSGEWELKTWRRKSTALLTLFHIEPSPTALKFVSAMLLPSYGWAHREAGGRYSEHEMSFRQTIYATRYSDRGFKVVLDDAARMVKISFNAEQVSPRHADWLESVRVRAGLGELNPQPYWGYDDLGYKAGSKLKNVFLIGADRRTQTDPLTGLKREFFHYNHCLMLSQFNAAHFIQLLADGAIYIDFDARSGHNHGTKFRLRQNRLPELYEQIVEVF